MSNRQNGAALAIVVGIIFVGVYKRSDAATAPAQAAPKPAVVAAAPAPPRPRHRSVIIAEAIRYARQQLGKPYQWGAIGPDEFDCSGLVMEAYLHAGVGIPRTSQEQWLWGPQLAVGTALEPGDLLFYAGADGTMTSPGHVTMYIGGGMMLEAYATGYPIRIVPMRHDGFVGATRPVDHAGVR